VEDEIDPAACRPPHPDLGEPAPTRMNGPEETLQHPRLVPVADRGSGIWVDSRAQVRPKRRRQLGVCLDRRSSGAREHAGEERRRHGRGSREGGVTDPSVQAQPIEIFDEFVANQPSDAVSLELLPGSSHSPIKAARPYPRLCRRTPAADRGVARWFALGPLDAGGRLPERPRRFPGRPGWLGTPRRAGAPAPGHPNTCQGMTSDRASSVVPSEGRVGRPSPRPMPDPSLPVSGSLRRRWIPSLPGPTGARTSVPFPPDAVD
jgi:hypothetical protein